MEHKKDREYSSDGKNQTGRKISSDRETQATSNDREAQATGNYNSNCENNEKKREDRGAQNRIKELTDRVNELFEEAVAIRRDLHAHPELSQQEARTEGKISEYLTAWGIPHQTGVAGHGVVGLIRGKGPGTATVAIRADMDALPIGEQTGLPYESQNPGVMHACGHDIHTAVLLGAAKVLKDMKNSLPGKVKLIFQPAEETVGGALPMIQAGCLENPHVDAVIGLHVEPGIPAGGVEFRRGGMNAASNEFTIKVIGESSHGARPEKGVDAILAASQIVGALQTVASRNVAATDPALITVGQFYAGTASNVLANQAVLHGIIRTLNKDTRALAIRRTEEIAQSIAQAYGASAEVSFVDGYPALINDDEIESLLEETAAQYLPPGSVYFRPQSSMGAEDFSYFCNAVKGAYFNIGTAASEADFAVSLHSERYCPDESCIRAGILMEAAGALAILDHLNERNGN